jgi:hypothetical protein
MKMWQGLLIVGGLGILAYVILESMTPKTYVPSTSNSIAVAGINAGASLFSTIFNNVKVGAAPQSTSYNPPPLTTLGGTTTNIIGVGHDVVDNSADTGDVLFRD